MIFILMMFLSLTANAASIPSYSKVFDVVGNKDGKPVLIEVLVEETEDRGWNTYINNDISALGLSPEEIAKARDKANDAAILEGKATAPKPLKIDSAIATEKVPQKPSRPQ